MLNFDWLEKFNVSGSLMEKAKHSSTIGNKFEKVCFIGKETFYVLDLSPRLGRSGLIILVKFKPII